MEQRPWKEFEAEWTNAIVDSINFVRERRDLTIKDLAGLLNQVGWEISNATLSGILSGRKRTSISVAEMTAFARALDVSPTLLYLGLPGKAELPVNPLLWGREQLSTVGAAAWLRAYASPPSIVGGQTISENLREAVSLVMHHSNAKRTVAWQAALVVAADRLAAADVEKLRSEYSMRRDALASAVARLLGDHVAARDLGEFGPRLPPLPGPLDGLGFADIGEVVERMSIDDVRQLTSGEHVAQAHRRWLDRLEEIDGAPTNPAE